MSNAAVIVPFNWPGGSTLQWEAGRGVLCRTPVVMSVVRAKFSRSICGLG